MKKSIIWLLTIVMAITFGGLVYIQILYMDRMTGMRNEQFDENARRALYGVANELERMETLHYLEQDIEEIQDIEAAFYTAGADSVLSVGVRPVFDMSATSLDARYRLMQQTIRRQYLYQRELINEVILSIMREGSQRPVMERADSAQLRSILKTELAAQGIALPFEFKVISAHSAVYSSGGYVDSEHDTYTQELFPSSPSRYYLKVYFPTKGDYIYHSVRWLIPTLAFTLILLLVFVYTIVIAFRQKKLTEMKTDFINNMTHEYKTPISTISLAGQMLGDPSVNKSPAMLTHLAGVITDESKRLRFQVEKVLQMSMFDGRGPNIKFSEVDANAVISQVVNTFKIKVEKFGGHLDMNLEATNALILVDEMHFTNVIFNLLDNAVKYRREDVDPVLMVSTVNPNESRIEIRISDNGIGIKKEHLRRIFDRFYRVPTGNRHDVKGFGLGLAYVSKLIEAFKGSVKAESEPGVGTAFIISLPLAVTDDCK